MKKIVKMNTQILKVWVKLDIRMWLEFRMKVHLKIKENTLGHELLWQSFVKCNAFFSKDVLSKSKCEEPACTASAARDVSEEQSEQRTPSSESTGLVWNCSED